MGILREFFAALRPQTECNGCGRSLKVCDRQCEEAAELDLAWDSIK